MKLADFDYELPPELIAQAPPAHRTASRLLHLEGERRADGRFSDLPELIGPDDLLVFNDTRVVKARLFGQKESGGKVEVFVERLLGGSEALAFIRASKSPKAGGRIQLVDGSLCTVIDKQEDQYRIAFDQEAEKVLDRLGKLPLPPYIDREAAENDDERYQTVYARNPGAVAAPTAGLHFDEAMLEHLKGRGARLAWVTLHVGAGTFLPVRVENVRDHIMHGEVFHVPEETVAAIEETHRRGGRVLAVGTTSLRALEAAAQDDRLKALSDETHLFILPGYRFRVVDRLLTNFHLPRSTLLMLVAAFAGQANILAAYRHAVEERYRFFSYGDAMLIERWPV